MDAKYKEGPDKGWCWVVAFAACFNSLVLAGIFRTSGVLFVAFISAFGVTREEASWPVVLCISVLNLTGPFSGILGQRYGVRPVTIAGAIVATIGVSACYFTTSLKVITFLFGVVFGIGYGLVSTLMPVIVNVYFLNLRATANGIANSGSCFGSVILPVLFEYLIHTYGLSGCFLLTGGIVLHIAIAGALLRPPSWLQKPKRKEVEETLYDTSLSILHKSYPEDKVKVTNKENNASSYNAVIKSIKHRNSLLSNSTKLVEDNTPLMSPMTSNNPEDLNFCVADRNSELHRNLQSELMNTLRHRSNLQSKSLDALTQKNTSLNQENLTESLDDDVHPEEMDSEVALYKSLKELEESLDSFNWLTGEDCSTEQRVDAINQGAENSSSPDSCTNRQLSSRSSSLKHFPSQNDNLPQNYSPSSKSENEISHGLPQGPSFKEDLPSEPLQLIDPVAVSTGEVSYTCNITEKLTPKEDSQQEQMGRTADYTIRSTIKTKDINSSPGVLESFSKVLTCPMFYVTAITNVSFYFLFHMYVVIIVDYSLDRGVPDSDTKYIIFAFSMSDLFGRLCLGWVTDRKFLRRSHFVMVCMAAIGIVFFCFPFAKGYGSLIAVSCCYGLLLGCTMVVFPILLVDFLGTELHPVAIGCMCFMNGFASFARPYLIGYFRDNVGSYANIFYILGIISVTASILWLLENCFKKKTFSPDIENNINKIHQ